jgi:hypothetical protein
MKALFTTLAIIACFTIKVNAQLLLSTPKPLVLDTIRKADTSLVSTFLNRNPNLFNTQKTDFSLSNRLWVYSNMPVCPLTADSSRMPVKKLHSTDKMPIKKW